MERRDRFSVFFFKVINNVGGTKAVINNDKLDISIGKIFFTLSRGVIEF